jgi:hypothetical protein
MRRLPHPILSLNGLAEMERRATQPILGQVSGSNVSAVADLAFETYDP